MTVDWPDPLSVAEARQHILALIRPLPAERRLLDSALGAVLATAVSAPVDAPAFDNSAMDGYAVRWGDVSAARPGAGVELAVPFEIAAGVAPQGRIEAGQAARIMTGARVPQGADTVVVREDTQELGDRVVVERAPSKGEGANIRRRGTYFAAGGSLLAAGTPIEAGAVGLLASVGVAAVSVRRRPRLAVVSTGDELVELHEAPAPGQIRNSSAYMLAALARESGCEPVVMPIARDTVAHCRARFEEALDSADAVVSIGGVSVGDYDVVREVMGELGAEMRFWRVRIKPGKPLAFGLCRGRPLIGLPGNPVSSFVAFYQFVRPALRRLAGFPGEGRLERVRARLAAPLQSPVSRADYQRGRLLREGAGWVFRPFPDQGSGNLTSIVATSGFAVIPEGVGQLDAGQEVEVERLPAGLIEEPEVLGEGS